MTHLDLAISLKGERQAIMESRAQIAWYVKGIKGAAAIRQRINSALTRAAVEEILKEL